LDEKHKMTNHSYNRQDSGYTYQQGQQQWLPEPHRGTMILIFGILGLFFNVIFAILAWVLGAQDLNKIDEGRMDPAGRSNTSTGRTLGIIGVTLNLLVVLPIIIYFFFVLGMSFGGGVPFITE